MARGRRLAARDQGGKPIMAPAERDSFAEVPMPLDLGIALSIYSKDPAGRLIALHETTVMPAGRDAPQDLGGWPTEQ